MSFMPGTEKSSVRPAPNTQGIRFGFPPGYEIKRPKITKTDRSSGTLLRARKLLFPEPFFMLRNSASGPEIGLPGRILAKLLPEKHRNRPSVQIERGRGRDLSQAPPEPGWAGKRPKIGDFRA